MNKELRICQNCKQNFAIEPEDFEFYKKIDVPPPTFCPGCRLQRRMTLRNERALYFVNCGLCGKKTISVYSPDAPFPVYDYNCWLSDNWDRFSYGREYDFSRPFLEQFKELSRKVPRYATLNMQSTNCDTCSLVYSSKNCYLSLVNASEDCSYVHGFKLRNSLDIYWGLNLDLSYECVDSSDSNTVFFSQYADNCSFSAFLYDCRNLQNCFGCVGLRNKSYYIFNKPYSKEDYIEKLKEYDLGSYGTLLKIKEEFKRMKMLYPRRFAHIVQSQNVTGNNIRETKNCQFCFDTTGGAENGKYLAIAGMNLKDSYDSYDIGTNSQLIYEGVDVGLDSSNILFSSMVWESIDAQYSKDCSGCSNIFGCIGLRNKKYCILNKQYSEEEYKELLPRIIKYMDDMPYTDKKSRVYKYGEFFPPELSPFAYNETIAQEFFPLTKEEAIGKGYSWKDPEPRNYQITIQAETLPDHIKEADDSILKEVIGCLHGQKCSHGCTLAFNIQPGELEFYRRMNIALPRLCPNCRHHARIEQRTPYKLWRRKCQCAGSKSEREVYRNQIAHSHGSEHCLNEFETSYAPDRPEIVYCESCYLSEVV